MSIERIPYYQLQFYEVVKDYAILFIGLLAVTTASFIVLGAKDSSGFPLDSVSLALIRVFLTGVLSFFLIQRLASSDSHTSSKTKKYTLLLIFISGSALAVHFTFWFISLNLLPVGVSLSLTNTAPIWILFFISIGLRKLPNYKELVAVYLSLFGVIILVINNASLDISSNYILGVILALISGMALALYLSLAKWGVQNFGLWKYFGMVNLSASVPLLVYVLLFSKFSTFSFELLFFGLILALIPGLIGHASFQFSMVRLRPSIVGALTLGEPVLGSIVAWIALNQVLNVTQIIGIFIVMLGIILVIFVSTTKENMYISEKLPGRE